MLNVSPSTTHWQTALQGNNNLLGIQKDTVIEAKLDPSRDAFPRIISEEQSSSEMVDAKCEAVTAIIIGINLLYLALMMKHIKMENTVIKNCHYQ